MGVDASSVVADLLRGCMGGSEFYVQAWARVLPALGICLRQMLVAWRGREFCLRGVGACSPTAARGLLAWRGREFYHF